MSRTHRILWGEGVFLRPQHFQQQERHFERRVAHCLALSRSHPWGVTAAELDPDALQGGLVSFSRLAVVFPDGTCLDAPDQDPLPPGRRLDDADGLGPDLLVHACLPQENPFGGNLGDAGRYRADQVHLADLFTEALEAEVSVLRAQPRLRLGGENRDGLLAVPCARLLREAGGWRADPGYLAPALTLAGAPGLLAQLRRLADILRAKSRALAEAHRERARGVLDYGTADIAGFWLLHTVNRAWPQVAHLLAFPQAHPEAAYAALAQLAGELLTFSTARSLDDLPGYRHDDLAGTFRGLEALLRELLETVISDRCAPIPLHEFRPACHVGRLGDERLLDACDFYLSVYADRPAAEWLEAVPRRLKVGSPDDVEKILNSALPGVPLHHVARTPASLPVRAGNLYFALEPGGAIFRRMLEARSVCIHVPQPLHPLKLELFAVHR